MHFDLSCSNTWMQPPVAVQPITRSKASGPIPHYFQESLLAQGGPWGSNWCAEKESERRYMAGVGGLEKKQGIDSKESERKGTRDERQMLFLRHKECSILVTNDSRLFPTTMCRIDKALAEQVLEQIFDEVELKQISPCNYNKASLLEGRLRLIIILLPCKQLK